MNEIQLGNINVGNHLRPYFIADLAANHDGELSRAKELIWIAKDAGAHCAKFQHFEADKIVNDEKTMTIEDKIKVKAILFCLILFINTIRLIH